MGRKDRAATRGYRAGPDSMWTCRASPPITRIELHRAFRLTSRALILGPHFAWGIVDILVLTVFSNPIMKAYLILKGLITSILRRTANDDNRSECRL
jgi:hypothetical protein